MGEPALRLVGNKAPGRSNTRDAGGRLVKQPPPFRRVTPDKPEDLGPDGSALWDGVVAELPRIERLKDLDSHGLEVACRTLDRWREAVAMRRDNGLTAATSQGVTVAPWVKVEEQAASAFRAWCAEFGLTPAAETKLATSKPDDADQAPF